MVKRKYELNENIFDIINRDSAYWIGFLYGDGNCTRENKVRITLQIKDYEQLVRFRNFVGSDDRPIKSFTDKLGHPYCGFEFRSWKVIKSLTKYELTKRKENRGGIHIDLLQDDVSRDFIRGLFDADGSFYYDGLHKNKLYSEITGRMSVLKDVKSILVRNKVIDEGKKIVKNGSVFRIRMAYPDTCKLIRFIYANKPKYYLSRKYGLALDYLERLNDMPSKEDATVQ